MPKKSKRSKARQRARPAGPAQERRPESRVAPTGPQAPVRTPSRTQDPSVRHRHVVPEVKRIAIIAGVIIVVLIILTLVLG